MSPNGKETVTLPHSTGGQCSPPGPGAAATGCIISGKDDKATHTDDETRKSSSEDGTSRAMAESFDDGISRTNRTGTGVAE